MRSVNRRSDHGDRLRITSAESVIETHPFRIVKGRLRSAKIQRLTTPSASPEEGVRFRHNRRIHTRRARRCRCPSETPQGVVWRTDASAIQQLSGELEGWPAQQRELPSYCPAPGCRMRFYENTAKWGTLMEAAQLVAPGEFELVELPDPIPQEDEVLVEMRSASICGSDLHGVFGRTNVGQFPRAPGQPGHEGIGTVIESRSAIWHEGDRVLTVPMPGQGACFATHQVVGAAFLVPLPADAELDRLLMAQQLGTVVFGFHRYWATGTPAEGRRAAIIGAGSAGLFALQLAKLAGFTEVLVSDLEPARLDVAKRLGAITVHAPNESFVEAVLALTDGEGADLVIEAAGFDSCRAECVEAVRRYGRVGYFGLPEAPGLVPFPFERAFRRACSIEMAGNAQLEPGLTSFREAVDLIASGKVNVDEFIESRYGLAEMTTAMQAAHERRAIKVSIDLAR